MNMYVMKITYIFICLRRDMRDFIFDQYGYYYSDSDASEFEFKGYEFKVMAHSLTEMT